MQAHPAGPGLPRRTGAVAAQTGELLPAPAAVDRAEERGVLHPGVDRVGVVQRRLEVPDPGELPGHRGAVEELMGSGVALVGELVAHRVPGAAAVVTALDLLAEPAAALRGVEPVGVRGRALDVVDLPAREVRPADLPVPARAVRRQHERTLPRAHEHPHTTHRCLLLPERTCDPWDGRPSPAADLIGAALPGVGKVPFIHLWRSRGYCTRPGDTDRGDRGLAAGAVASRGARVARRGRG